MPNTRNTIQCCHKLPKPNTRNTIQHYLMLSQEVTQSQNKTWKWFMMLYVQFCSYYCIRKFCSQKYEWSTLLMSALGGGGRSTGTLWNFTLVDRVPGVTILARPVIRLPNWSRRGTRCCLGLRDDFFSLGLGWSKSGRGPSRKRSCADVK